MPPASQTPSEPTPAAPPSPPRAPGYEAQHVHAVYSRIAPHFAATRHAPWPRVDAFLSALAPHSAVADVGCGNGKYLAAAGRRALYAVGTDLCAELVSYAAARPDGGARYDAAVADALRLPLRDASFDAALNIAVVHHLSTRERRVAALRETMRIVRPGGRALFYVWALERPSTPKPKRGNHGAKMLSRRFDAQDVFVPWHMRTRKEGAESDRILGDWKQVHRRFYHVYAEGELEDDLALVDGINILESYYDHQNWCAIVEKR